MAPVPAVAWRPPHRPPRRRRKARDTRTLVTGALLTGRRYGELAAVTAGDFDPSAGTVHVARSKRGRARHVALTDEGVAFFRRVAAGRATGERLFLR